MIIINNGFKKFHMAVAAAELARKDMLIALSTGAYPKSKVIRIIELLRLKNNSRIARLIDRGEDIPENLISADWVSDFINMFSSLIRQINLLSQVGSELIIGSLRLYGYRTVRIVKKSSAKGAKLYHYRAGFGHISVRVAKQLGIFTLCDYSIAHSYFLETLIFNNGKWPLTNESRTKISRIWKYIQKDADQADAILVNSDFVKETFLRMGYDPKRVHVIYLGVDDNFFNMITPDSLFKNNKKPIKFVFAGGIETRKGIHILSDAINLLDTLLDFELHIAGGVKYEAQDALLHLKHDGRIYYHGILSRKKLASLLSSADIFIFPSLAEGSARVVFEALACGCYIITTPNSGSIVENGVHGRIIEPGNSEVLANVIRETLLMDRKIISQIGIRNAQKIREQYRQSHYGEKLVNLYNNLLNNR